MPTERFRGFDWMSRANCRDVGTTNFFPGPHDMQEIAAAKAICASCAVKRECLAFAESFEAPPPGIWGGLAEHARKKVKRANRTDDVAVRTRDRIAELTKDRAQG